MKKEKNIYIFLVEEVSLYRQGVVDFLRYARHQDYRFVVTGQAGNYIELFNYIENKEVVECDILIIDILLPNKSGIEVVQQLKEMMIDCKVLFFGSYVDQDIIDKCRQVGGSGLLLKRDFEETLTETIVKIMNDETIFPNQSEKINLPVNGDSIAFLEYEKIRSILTPREFEVFCLFGQGLTIMEIADRIFVTRKCVESHEKKIKNKLRINTLAGLIKTASRYILTNNC